MNWLSLKKICSTTILAVICLLTQAFAQSLSITAPTTGDVLGKSNNVSFQITGASVQVKVIVKATEDADPTVSFSSEGFFTPDINKQIINSLSLNFDQAAPQGPGKTYTLTVTVQNTTGTTLTSSQVTGLTIAVVAPKFKNVIPANNSFVGTSALISADIESAAIDTWTVKVSGNGIPSNSGNTNQVSVVWNTTNIEADGAQSITIDATDKGRNKSTRTINVTIDRVSPSTTIQSPANSNYLPQSVIPVVISIADQSSGSVVKSGVDVSLLTMDGQFIEKVARVSARSANNGLQWIGRINTNRKVPNQFQLVVNATDRAGNKAIVQKLVVTLAGRKR